MWISYEIRFRWVIVYFLVTISKSLLRGREHVEPGTGAKTNAFSNYLKKRLLGMRRIFDRRVTKK